MSIDAGVETLKLARLVGAEPDGLAYLHELAAQTSVTFASRSR